MFTKKVYKILNFIVVAGLLLFFLLPFALTAGENRSAFDITGVGYRINDWLEKHALNLRERAIMGFRLNVMGISPHKLIHMGKDGWVFYTADYNLELPRGTYPLTQDIKDRLLYNVQKATDFYGGIGADFYYVLSPSKTTVYPEYIAGENLRIAETAIDILTDYINENANVNVVNTKAGVIAQKEYGKAFPFYETHWSDLGAYGAYKAILDKFNENGYDMKPIQVRFEDGPYDNLFEEVLKAPGLFGGGEVAPKVIYDAKARVVNDGDYYDALMKICEKYTIEDRGAPAVVLFENPTAKYGTLLIQADSQFVTRNCVITRYLAEHFKRTYYVYTGPITELVPELAEFMRPDVVMFSNAERTIAILPTEQFSLIPEKPDDTDISSFPPADPSNGGMIYFDTVNEQILSADTLSIGDDLTVRIAGYAYDDILKQPLSALYIHLGDTLYKCQYGIERADVASFYNVPTLVKTGFRVSIPKSAFEGCQTIEAIGISANGEFRYAPKVYAVD